MQLPNIKDARIRTKEKIEVSYDKYKWVDIVLGTHNIYDIPILLENITKERKTKY
jgi:hypothetical protein